MNSRISSEATLAGRCRTRGASGERRVAVTAFFPVKFSAVQGYAYGSMVMWRPGQFPSCRGNGAGAYLCSDGKERAELPWTWRELAPEFAR